MNYTTDKSEISRLIDIVENINARLSAIESAVGRGEAAPRLEQVKQVKKESSEDLEFRIGEQWFGKIGIIAFLFAVFYLFTLNFREFSQVLVIGGGMAASLLLIGLSFFKDRQLKSLSGYIAGAGMIVLFFSTAKLHYFSEYPVLGSPAAVIPLLLLVSAGTLAAALRKNSAHLTGLSFLLAGIAALLSDTALVLFPVLFVTSLLAINLAKKYNWEGVVLFSIPLTYVLLFLWFINNPLLGKAVSVTELSPYLLLVVPLFISVYGFTQAKNGVENTDSYQAVLKTLLNSVPGYLLFMFLSFNFAGKTSAMLNFFISLLFLALGAYYWSKERSKISTFVYSMVGYGALSLAIVQNFSSPASFIWLCWQSLLVVSTALWFRSRFIIVTNFFIYISLTISYLFLTIDYGIAGISFGLVSLISARLINIHQARLELQSEQMRNAYLVIAMLVIPLILYSIVPDYLVGISWIALAYVYYVIGKLLNNKKYRLMASGTLILSLAYIFIFGIISSEATFKIISFMLVSAALVIISIVYARVRSRETPKVE